ncbi:SusD/RagB family nutrient-binding outer membrane lipoprotein [Carboxylicivirga caseinilyticus]|uniref:SusD/RagB family nutrient-binding outer membrane lipoprotein n=1 Tax=Carboxylicivirga caseinilyticus TaxID=3417572 RepID=UPI003D3498E3|nr:SusD/RagB family nutrient-binding outer membrane lipoprotein [Marinilabiliaceae bacterium A049]
MKKYIATIFSAVFLLYVTGCTSDFDEINTNPNTLTSDQLDASMAGPSFANAQYKGLGNASWSISGDDYGTYGLATMLHSMLFVHYFSCGSTGWQTERNGVNDGWRSRGWLRFYTLAVPSLRNAYTAAEGDEEALAVLDIWKVFMYHRFTDSWGPIAYSAAGQGGASVAYDLQEDMYDDFFALLENANETLSGLNGTVGIFKDYDAIYGGDTELWRKFANSMRLRLALRISDIDPSRAQEIAEAAVAAGVMESNDDCAYFAVTSDTYNNFVDIAKYWGFYMSADMESILKGYNDPRMEIWYGTNGEGEYIGQPNGGGTTRDWSTSVLSQSNQETTFGDNTGHDIEVMMAAESYFNRAECALKGWNMSGTAKDLYEEGVRLSLSQWGVSDASAIDTYLAGTTTAVEPTLAVEYTKVGGSATPPVDVPVSWGATEAEQLKQIAVQKYLALFPESWETWADLRRSDADILYPLLYTEDADGNYGVMRRLTYVPTEYSTNEAAVNEAVSSLSGGDKGSVRVWWDVN